MNGVTEAICDAPELTPEVLLAEELAPHLDIVKSAIQKAEDGDAGAPFEKPCLEALRAIKKASPAEFIRLRGRLKRANPEVLVGELDKCLRGENDGNAAPESVADELVSMVRDVAELFHGEDGTAYASFDKDEHRETWPLDSTGFREWLAATYYRETDRAPSEAAIGTALCALAGIGKFDGPEVPVWLRLARQGDRYYLDLCNDRWQAVEVSRDGWQVLDHPPVRFRRTPTMRPLPAPCAGGDLDRLWEFVNVVKDDQPFFLAAMMEMCRPDTDFVVCEFVGEQGSGKSDTQSTLRSLIDPSAVNLRAAPKAREDVFVAAANNWVVSLNNLSHLTSDYQDALCTLSTGGGFAGRTLYTNTEETVVEVKRPVLFNGIAALATAQDLVDRTIRFDLPEISAGSRRPKSEMAEAFEEARPEILGAVLDLFSRTLRELPEVKLETLPRMGDFARLGEAMFRAMGRSDSFLSLYQQRRDEAALLALEGSPVGVALLAYMDGPGRDGWHGTVRRLLEVLTLYKKDSDAWPRSPRGLSDLLRRAAPALRVAGVEVKFEGHRRDGNHVRITQRDPPSSGRAGEEAKDIHDVHQVHRGAKSASSGERGASQRARDVHDLPPTFTQESLTNAGRERRERREGQDERPSRGQGKDIPHQEEAETWV